MVVPEKSNPTPNDIIFLVEGTALCGVYLNELRQAYILPTLEYFNGGPLDEKDCGSASNYAIYGLVVFHAADILPGYLTEAHGPITTPHKLMTTLDKIQFSGGHGEAVSHIGEGFATALQCLEDITSFRNPPLETPAKKHIILICNCKPYGLPIMESVGSEGQYRGMTAEQLAAKIQEMGVHLSIMSPRKIPSLISLFDKSGGESSSQKTYARDVRHLILLSGFHLQERPITPKQVPEVPIMNPPPPAAVPISQAQVPTSVTQSLPPPPSIPSIPPPQQQTQQQQLPVTMPSQPTPPPQQQQPQQQQQAQPPTPHVVPPPPPVQVQPPTLPPVSSQAPMMSTASSVIPTSSMQQSSMAMSTASTVSMAQSPAGNTGSPMMMNQNQPPSSMGMNLHPPQQQQAQQANQLQQQQQQQQQQMILIRNRAPMQMQNIRQMQINQQINPNQPLNPNQMQGHVGQPMPQVSMSNTGGPQQLVPGQQMNPQQQMMNSQQMMTSQAQMNMNQQQQISQQQQMNPQLNQQLNQQQQQQQMNPQLNQQLNQQQQQQQMNPQLNQQLQNQQQQQQQQMNQSMNPNQMGQQFQNQQLQQMNQQMAGQPQMTPAILGPRLMSQQLSQQQPQVSQPPGPPTSQNMARWPNQMQKMQQQQQQQQVPLVRMSNVNQPQMATATSGQPLQTQMSAQQPILSTGIQPSALQQQLQNPQQNQPQQQQTTGHSTLLAQLKNPPIGSQQPLQQPPQSQPTPSGLMTGPQIATQRLTIWSGTLEWHEKQKGPPDGQKVPRQVPCKVSTNVVNGEPEVKGDGWPQKLIMQLIPKNIVGSLGGSYLVRDVKTVMFMLQNCDALNSLTRVMDSGYAGCVHFTGTGMQQAPCTIKVLILLYSKDKQAYLGFIPNDQAGFVDRIRKVIQQQKQQQTTRNFPGTGGMPPTGLIPGQQAGPGMVQGQQPGMMLQGTPQQQGMVQQTPISSLAQQLGQTPQGAMGQSPVTQQLVQQLGQAQLQQQQLQQQQQQMQNPGMGGNLDAQNVDNQLEMERQQNLLTIQQLQATLQAAQQKELQFQMGQQVPGVHPQQQGQIQVQVQQQQQQQQIMQGGPGQQQQLQQQPRQQMMTAQAMNQMRMMRNSVSQANPGLKHLLQQTPGPQNYRIQQQMPMQRMPGQMGMSGQMAGPGGPIMQQNQQQQQQVQQQQFEEVGILDLLK